MAGKIERASGGRAARQDVVGNRAKGEDIRTRGAFVAGGRGFRSEIYLGGVYQVILDMMNGATPAIPESTQ